MNRYLLEIGVEEFPAKYIKGTQNQLRNGFEEILSENNYSFEKIQINSTPRRFAILIEGIKSIEENSIEKVKGPSKKIAFDENNNPSRALQGFIKSKGIELKDIVIEKLNDEDYIYALIKKETISLDKLLMREVPNIIKSITNPRQMKWGGKNIKFLRPIRWILSLLNDEVLEFDLENIRVSNITKGHRTLGSSEIVISTIDEYEQKLRDNYVIVNEAERRKMIIRGINLLAREKSGNYTEDEDLLQEVIHINEYPTPFLGNFDPKYLSLPKEVIVTPMKDHQRYFPVEQGENLLPYFISVRNGDSYNIENVIAGNEKVLVARLEDAKFFFEKDIAKPLEEYVDELENVGFHDGLGTMFDKTRRLEILVEKIGKEIMAGEEVLEISKRAAYLSKADLVTNIVIEFTELQGIIGRKFAEISGEKDLVAQSIEEQYLPTKSGGALPKTTSGIVLSVADKLDTIIGLYSKGIEVTGSQDPYGQRRAALGILQTLAKYKIDLDLKNMIREGLYIYLDMFGETFDFNEVSEKIEIFIVNRLRNLLIDEGYRYDIVDSVIDFKNLNIHNIYQRVKIISNLSKDNNLFEEILTLFVRIVNIASKSVTEEINEEILEDNDKKLLEELKSLEEVLYLIDKENYEMGVLKLKDISRKVDDYLNDTHIMVEDEMLRNSRLTMIRQVSNIILGIFDPTKIVR